MANPLPVLALRVLIVDDNAGVANSLAILLRLWGHEAAAAQDGPAALEVAAVFRPDVALLDLGLPGMDGCEVGRRLRELPGLEGLFLIALTGYADTARRRRAAEADFAFYFVKTAGPESLEATLRALARKKGGGPAGRVSEPGVFSQ
jgi:two-component system CheB/CheR fusion protein